MVRPGNRVADGDIEVIRGVRDRKVTGDTGVPSNSLRVPSWISELSAVGVPIPMFRVVRSGPSGGKADS